MYNYPEGGKTHYEDTLVSRVDGGEQHDSGGFLFGLTLLFDKILCDIYAELAQRLHCLTVLGRSIRRPTEKGAKQSGLSCLDTPLCRLLEELHGLGKVNPALPGRRFVGIESQEVLTVGEVFVNLILVVLAVHVFFCFNIPAKAKEICHKSSDHWDRIAVGMLALLNHEGGV